MKLLKVQRFVLLVVIVCSSISLSYSQDCDQIFSEAQDLYKQGKFAAVLEKVKECKEGTDQNIEWKRYRLQALAHLGNLDDDYAREAAFKMMDLSPSYTPDLLKDPNDFIQLINSITVIPKFSLGGALSIGTNWTFPKVEHAYMINSQTKTYTGKNSYQFGFSSGYQFNQFLGLNASLTAFSKSYNLEMTSAAWETNVKEKLTYLMLPVNLRFTPEFTSRIRPYAQFGFYADYLLYTDNSYEANYLPTGDQFKLEHISSIDRRNRSDFGWTTGLGASYRKGDGQLFIQMSYFNAFGTITKEGTRYDNPELAQDYYYLDDDLKLNNLSIGVGYSVFLNYKVIR